MSRMQQRIDDYIARGVGYVWVVDPQTHRAWIDRRGGMHEAAELALRTTNPDIEILLAVIFAQ